MSFNQTKEIPMKHLFDGIDLNVYEKNVINLSAGTPSLELLKDCPEIFNQGTKHRMVKIIIVLRLSCFIKLNFCRVIYLRNDRFKKSSKQLITQKTLAISFSREVARIINLNHDSTAVSVSLKVERS
jgi:hypothetical protein